MEHPLAGLVTVIVYVPARLTVGVHVVPPAVIPGPVHEQVAPPVDEDPARLTDVIAQVRFCGGPALAFGGVLFKETATIPEAVHPLAGFVVVMV